MTTTPTPETLKEWRFSTLGCGCETCAALLEATTAVEALIAERESLLSSWKRQREADVAAFKDLHDVRSAASAVSADQRQERNKLKAQLDVAVDALHDVCDHHGGERSCRSVYSDPDSGPCDCHVDQARAALAKIKEMT